MRDEIDLLDALHRVWQGRRIVAVAVFAAIVLGVVLSLTRPIEYTAHSVMIPQDNDNGRSSGIPGGLAAMAGLDDGEAGLGPDMYPQIVSSIPFQKELMAMTVDSGERGRVTLLDYFTEPSDMPDAAPEYGDIEFLTPREDACKAELSGRVSLSYNDKAGDLRLSATMPEALMAAEVAQRAQELLQEHVVRLKVQKVQSTLDFIEERTEEAKADFERAQGELASFRDRNRNIVTATAEVRGQRLQNESDLAFGIYSTLARQREQARIELKENTPVFMTIEPVTIPMRRSAPNRKMIVAVFTLLGVLVGCGIALAKSYSKEKRAQ